MDEIVKFRDGRRACIRLARPEEAEAALAIATEAYAKYVSRMAKPPAPVFYDYAAVFSEGNSYALSSEEAMIAMVTLVPFADHLLLRNLAVATMNQGQGVGTLLLAFAERRARALDVSEIRLWTNEKMTENVPFYEGFGYKVVDRAIVDGYSRIFMSKAIPGSGRSR